MHYICSHHLRRQACHEQAEAADQEPRLSRPTSAIHLFTMVAPKSGKIRRKTADFVDSSVDEAAHQNLAA